MRERPIDDSLSDGQLPKSVYLRLMASMKEILNLGEIKFGDRRSEQYKYFKKVVMNQFYEGMTDIFSTWERAGIVEKCPCGTSIRNGYKPCEDCHGASFRVTEEFKEWFDSTEE